MTGNFLGTIRTLDYDKLGRLQHDRVTGLGSGVDFTIMRITRTYDNRGLLQKLTSYNNQNPGSGTILDEVQYAYDGFALLVTEYQSHLFAANPSTTPKVQYAYTDGSHNHARRTSITHPDGTVLTYEYGSAGGADDVLNRVK